MTARLTEAQEAALRMLGHGLPARLSNRTVHPPDGNRTVNERAAWRLAGLRLATYSDNCMTITDAGRRALADLDAGGQG